MREIKFRAFDFKVKQMFIVKQIHIDMMNSKKHHKNRVYMQLTGLKDRNGVEIYEGDIVKMFGFDKAIEVVFKKGSFGYFGMIHKNFVSFSENYNFNFLDNKSNEIEVIGNIHENKELLND